jgi:hypothetical protein
MKIKTIPERRAGIVSQDFREKGTPFLGTLPVERSGLSESDVCGC